MKAHKRRRVTTIQRRDFLNGAALALGGLLMPKGGIGQNRGADATADEYYLERGITEQDSRYYPPELTGMRGNHPGSFEAGHHLRDLGSYQASEPSRKIDDEYDLIVVGGGISGLSAAWFYREQRPDARILIIENHDDFGGHAKRNEFHSSGKLLIGYGGTQSIEAVGTYGPEALRLLKALGIELKRFERYYDSSFEQRFGLTHCEFFDKETFGQDRLVPDYGKPDWTSYLKKAPLSERSRADLLRIQTQKIDYLRGMSLSDKKYKLTHMSFADFLIHHAKVGPQVVQYFQHTTNGGLASGIDAISALSVITLGLKPDNQAFLGGPTAALARGLGLTDIEFPAEPYIYHFPDGNASIARMLVRSMIPGVAPGNTIEDIVTARFDYARLDNPHTSVRIRLNSTVVRVLNVEFGSGRRGTEVTYLRRGVPFRVTGKSCVLACWNAVIPYLCPEMSAVQRTALSSAVKAPLVYTNVQIRNWRAIHAARLRTSYCPGSFFSEVYLDWPVSIGGYRYAASPEDPAILHLVRVPTSPGLPVRDQYRAGRAELYSMPFEVFERNIRIQLARMFGGFGFDPRTDIEAITVNRWAHGYAYSYQPLWDGDKPDSERPNVVGRQRFGKITIANSDAGAVPETQVAIAEAYRAVHELLSPDGLARTTLDKSTSHEKQYVS